MIFAEAYAWLKSYGPEVGRLMRLGDKTALALFKAYSDYYDDQKNPVKQRELIHLIEEYGKRSVTITERSELRHKFGEDLSAPKGPPRIVVP